MRVTHRYKLMQVRGLTALLLRHAEHELTWILFSTLTDCRHHHQGHWVRNHGRQGRSEGHRPAGHLTGSGCESSPSHKIFIRCSVGQKSDTNLPCLCPLQGIGSALSTMGNQVSSQACVPHQDVALACATLLLWSSIGASIGSAMSVAIWSNTMPGNLAKFMPASVNETELQSFFDDSQSSACTTCFLFELD